jgi:tRNA uridine 5-carboxymethylaminomethyl modification enzyme
MKTGTPPRVDGRSLNYDRMEVQPGDENPGKFSYTDTPPLQRRTLLLEYLHQQTGTRYPPHGFRQVAHVQRAASAGSDRATAPALKIKLTVSVKKMVTSFLWNRKDGTPCEIYVNGFSSSLPEDVQFKALRLIPGFENVKMFRPGYAIEYDYFPPTQLDVTLETQAGKEPASSPDKSTAPTGYEEASLPGLMAGINAALAVKEEEPLILKRSEAYIGVLIDDLVNKGTRRALSNVHQPRRVPHSAPSGQRGYTSDAHRPSPRRQGLGCAHGPRAREQQAVKEIEHYFRNTSVTPDDINSYLSAVDSAPINQKQKLHSILLRPQTDIRGMAGAWPELAGVLNKYEDEFLELAEIAIKYEGYIKKKKNWWPR